jgi:hypothetical protein
MFVGNYEMLFTLINLQINLLFAAVTTSTIYKSEGS